MKGKIEVSSGWSQTKAGFVRRNKYCFTFREWSASFELLIRSIKTRARPSNA